MNQKDLEERYLNEIQIKDSKTIYHEMRDIKNWDKEVLVAFYLDSKNRIISREIVSIGILNQTVIHPREVFRTAIARNANALIISHNHPSGQTKPSSEDIRVTKELKKAGKLLHIQLLDHVIVTNEDFFSFSTEGII